MQNIAREGAMVAAKVGHDLARHHSLLARGDIPRLHGAKLLVDTGAELSFINEAIAIDLQLRFVRDQEIVGVSQRPETHRIYFATLHLGFEKPDPTVMLIPVALAGMRETTGRLQFDGILGRDFLAAFDFAYSGPKHTFALGTDCVWPTEF